MNRYMQWRAIVLWLVILIVGCHSDRLAAQEFRAFWVDGFHAGFKTPSQVSQLISDVRAANCNAVIVEVRKRGDAYYQSQYEPRATDISPSDFDPLDYLLNRAHNTNDGPRIEVHAWIVTYPIWASQTSAPPQPDHPYNLHPDWLSQDVNGNQYATAYFLFDPGHPEVQEHTYNVCMDILANYDVDGLNFDYVRYPNYNWGYNEVAVARFNARSNRTGIPSTRDPVWLQWRRDQVSALVRKVYVSAMALKPNVKISADTFTTTPSVVTDQEYHGLSSAYTTVLQDWRSWMEEGILDINIPMTYFRQSVHGNHYARWIQYIKNRRYNRHAVIGPGIYLNSISNGIYQMRLTREVTAEGHRADGVCGYSYAVPATNNVSNLLDEFIHALTQPSPYDSMQPPLFANPAAPPEMPWKRSPTTGHLKGYVQGGLDPAGFDGVRVSIVGPDQRELLTDATGFYAAVDLSPGQYTLAVSQLGFQSFTTNFTISSGTVATRDVILSPASPHFVLQPQNQKVPLGGNATFTSEALGAEPLGYFWRKNGPIVPGSTNATLVLSNVQYDDAGTYFAVATNAAGFAVSSNANLEVLFPFENLAVSPGERAALVSWTTYLPTTSQVDYGVDPNSTESSLFSAQLETEHTVLLAGLTPNTQYIFRALAQIGANEFRSEVFSFRTAGEIILDNPDATTFGIWAAGDSAAGRYGENYLYSGVTAGAASRVARFNPVISTPGYYDVFVWYPQGDNRSTNVPYRVVYQGGAETTYLNQQAGGGAWRPIASQKYFEMGSDGYVEISNATGESGVSRVVIADAVRLSFVPGQEPPGENQAPAWWAQYYFGPSADLTLDYDNDGYATWMEYRLGTVPTNSSSRLEMDLAYPSPLRLVFSPYLPDRAYVVESSPNLASPDWSRHSNLAIIPQQNGQALIILPLDTGHSKFYRLAVGWK